MAGGFLCALAVDHHDASVERRKSEYQLGGDRIIRAENGACETAAATASEGNGVIDRVVRHQRADRAEGFHGMDRRGPRWLTAVQQRRAHKCTAVAIGTHERGTAALTDEYLRFALEPRNLLQHFAPLA